MSCNVIPFFLRDVTSYRLWLNKTTDPRVLREVGLCVCDDLEEALNVIDERGDAFERQNHSNIDAARKYIDAMRK